jgi:outer membrane lipoprotein-sorting protein
MAALTAPRRRLTLAGLAALLVAALLVAGARAAVSASPLPDIAADELLGSVADGLADPPPITGEIAATLELGLPDVQFGEQAGEGVAALAGDQRLRVWRSPDGLRVARLTETSEQAFVSNGTEAWFWDSAGLTAERAEVPQRADEAEDEAFDAAGLDPVGLAGQALDAVDDVTRVSVDRAGRVAGRDTYRLVLEPNSDDTLIGRVELDIDGEQRIPLRTAVFARDAEAPSVEVAFTSVSFDAIDPATFDFTPPPGATVTERAAGEAHEANESDGWRGGGFGTGRPDVRTFGDGWATVVALPRPADTTGDAAPEGSAGQLDQLLPFTGPLFSVRTAEAGGQEWLLFGAVGQDALDRAADQLP